MDLFGGQFGVSQGAVWRLEVETGEVRAHSSCLEEWAERVLEDRDFETGWSLGQEWQRRNRALRMFERLLPVVPFAMGGDFVPDNLVAVELNEALRMYGLLSQQLEGVPDGTCLTVRGWLSRSRREGDA